MSYTMMTLNATLGSIDNFTDILVTPNHYRVANIVIASGEGKLKRGAMLGKVAETGKYRLWSTANEDGSEEFAGILGVDVDATDGDALAYMYVEGTFDATGLTSGNETIVKGIYLNGNIVIV